MRSVSWVSGFMTMGAVALSSLPASADKLVIGMPEWPSAEVTANIIAIAARERFGIDAELRPRGTMTILGDIANGSVQVHPEIWLPNLAAQVERLTAGGGPLHLSGEGVSATQNICTTPATVKETGISRLADLADPQIAGKFDTDGDGKGEIWIGARTWSSTEIEYVRARSYGYDKTMTLLEMPEDVAMAAVDAAVALSRPIVFYCYGPHHVFQLHDIVTLEEPAYDASRWTLVKRSDDPDWLAKSRAETAWDHSHFHIGYAARLVTDMPELARFLDGVHFEADDITAMSYAVQVERKSPEEVARAWIAANGARLDKWAE